MVAQAPVWAQIGRSRVEFRHSAGAPPRRLWPFLADSRQRAERGPADSLPLRVVLPCFAFGIVAGGVLRGDSGRCARGGSVVRFLPRAMLFEVGENGSDGVSPSTLLFVVRAVAHLWRQEAQNRNAQEIAKRGAELYDRLVGFVEDLRSVGDKLGAAQTAYTNAEKRLSTGKGNVIRQAEMLRELGVKPSKQLNKTLLDAALSAEERLVLEALPPDPGAPALTS